MPLSQTPKLRFRASANLSFRPSLSLTLILNSHLPGVMPQLANRMASWKIQTNNIIIVRKTLGKSSTEGANIPSAKPSSNENRNTSTVRAK
ncbi:MAG: hypothetical protein A2Z25_14140 [Planctomycetes bacterium RBG_16_55_9]|nr:MAG: hypothetical protein A2Z25_14140 [Planctomycetes bacterium RBG_16_55_9]